jgi:hypothetical protein
LRVGESLQVRASAEDPDGHDVRLEYEWLVNGLRLRHVGNELPAERLAVGDRAEVLVRASDGVESSEVLRRGPVERINALPVVTSRPPSNRRGGPFEYRIRAEDPDDARRLRLRLVGGPRRGFPRSAEQPIDLVLRSARTRGSMQSSWQSRTGWGGAPYSASTWVASHLSRSSRSLTRSRAIASVVWPCVGLPGYHTLDRLETCGCPTTRCTPTSNS